ncbi:MAG TPA: hypothetical protein VFN40_07745, partial [Gemmatimonadales bacterium]|nr:hypothetical protein [Gemmatimonadales bacterium]
MGSDRRRRPAGHESRVFIAALLAGLPAVLLASWLLWTGPQPLRTKVTLSLIVVGVWLVGSAMVRERVLRPLQTIANLLAALREGDYSIRARGARADDGLSLALLEINTLSETLRGQRRHALEATALLRRVMEEIDVAVFAFDGAQRLRLVNRGGERLLDQPAERLLGLGADALGLADCLEGETPRTVEAAFPGGTGRWELRGSIFRQDGLPHRLLVLSDLSRVLRAEERSAWQRIVRVLGHEINNSLAPIKSIARSLQRVLKREPRSPDWEQEALHGLDVIEGRSGSLSRFLQAYARLAQLPKPVLRPVDVESWVRRVVELEERMPIVLCL